MVDFSVSLKAVVAEGFQIETATDRATNNTQIDITRLTNNILTNGSWGVTTALAFGFAITVLAYATAHLSGGQINPAVTFGLTLSRQLGFMQAVCNIAAQCAGALLGAILLYATIPQASKSTLGANALTEGVAIGNALCGEIVMTFVLVSVVLETASNSNPMVRSSAPLAIGFAVFCAHAVLLPIDGCSINPARSLGPAVVSGDWANGKFWIFVVGPFLGALAAVPFHYFYNMKWDTKAGRSNKDPLVLRRGSDKSFGQGDNSDVEEGKSRVPHGPIPATFVAQAPSPAPLSSQAAMPPQFVVEGVLRPHHQ
ncbi:hypothetical protein N2152v2_011193 [Parachlorella kessleri]